MPSQTAPFTVQITIDRETLRDTLITFYEQPVGALVGVRHCDHDPEGDLAPSEVWADALLGGRAVEVLETADDAADNVEHRINVADLRAGIAEVARVDPRRFAELLAGSGDAVTATVLFAAVIGVRHGTAELGRRRALESAVARLGRDYQIDAEILGDGRVAVWDDASAMYWAVDAADAFELVERFDDASTEAHKSTSGLYAKWVEGTDAEEIGPSLDC